MALCWPLRGHQEEPRLSQVVVLLNFPDDRYTIHIRHVVVNQDAVQRPAGLDQGQRRGATGGCEDANILEFQNIGQQCADPGIIINYKYVHILPRFTGGLSAAFGGLSGERSVFWIVHILC